MIPARATTPTTTPAAIPAVLGPLLVSSGSGEAVALTRTTVLVAVAAAVDFDEELEGSGWKYSTSFRVSPVSLTHSLPAPPPTDC
jgi:hypothetical protein